MEVGSYLPSSVINGKWLHVNPVFYNKPIVILFWSIGCNECKILLNRCRRERWNEENLFQFCTVHIPLKKEDMDEGKVEEYCRIHRIDMPVLLDHQFKVADDFNNDYVPKMYLFDNNMQLRKKQSGFLTLQQLKHMIRKWM